MSHKNLSVKIKIPKFFRDKLKPVKNYVVKNESTIFLISLIHSLTINILNSYKGHSGEKPLLSILDNPILFNIEVLFGDNCIP